MSFISVFDVLGPNMIGPSSSHTAGAAPILQELPESLCLQESFSPVLLKK